MSGVSTLARTHPLPPLLQPASSQTWTWCRRNVIATRAAQHAAQELTEPGAVGPQLLPLGEPLIGADRPAPTQHAAPAPPIHQLSAYGLPLSRGCARSPGGQHLQRRCAHPSLRMHALDQSSASGASNGPRSRARPLPPAPDILLDLLARLGALALLAVALVHLVVPDVAGLQSAAA